MRNVVKIALSIFLLIAFVGCSRNNLSEDNKQNFNESDQNEYSDETSTTYEEIEVKYKKSLFDKTAKVVGFEGDGNKATIDFDFDDYEVTSVGEAAFANCSSLETVLFWADIKEIESSAFKNCSNLKTIAIPYETETIGDNAFQGCTSLESVIIWGDSEIGEYAFSGCTSLKEISIPYDTKKVGAHAFDGCTSLEKVIVWNDETIIESTAFDNCPKLIEKPATLQNNEDNNIKGIGNESTDEKQFDSNKTEVENDEIIVNSDEIKMPYSYRHYLGEDSEEVITELKELGFTNISVTITYEITKTMFFLDSRELDEIDSISIAGREDFNEDTIFKKDSEIILCKYGNVVDDPNMPSVTVGKLYDDLYNNAYNAKNTYFKKYYKISGYVGNIDDSGSAIELFSSNYYPELYGVLCTTSDEKDEVAKLRVGDYITVIGYVMGVDSELGYTVQVEKIN